VAAGYTGRRTKRPHTAIIAQVERNSTAARRMRQPTAATAQLPHPAVGGSANHPPTRTRRRLTNCRRAELLRQQINRSFQSAEIIWSLLHTLAEIGLAERPVNGDWSVKNGIFILILLTAKPTLGESN
jgi:hypothetical protein